MTKNFLIIALATLITVIAWVGFDIYDKRQRHQIPANIQELTAPIETTFDLDSIK
jgi:hypothetical protein